MIGAVLVTTLLLQGGVTTDPLPLRGSPPHEGESSLASLALAEIVPLEKGTARAERGQGVARDESSPGSATAGIGIDQNLGAQVDPSIVLRDENGKAVRLSEFLGRKPIVLTPVYYECPMLCSMQLNGLLRALKVMPYAAGKEFEILTFSIDPNETPDLARGKKDHYIRDYGKPTGDAGWRFLTGDAESIRALTESIGFHYKYDQANRQWSHATTLLVLTPAGRISQYMNGVEYDPEALKYSLIEASEGRIGSIIDRAVLFCFRYDATTGKYSLMIMRIVRLAGIATVLAIVGFWAMSRKGVRV